MRTVHHERLSGLLASYPDDKLAALASGGQTLGVGVGGDSALIGVDGTPVFVKRIPLTDRELAHPHSTANLFELPTFCQYGMGGPGFNAWRELAANMTVTEAVLAGETEGFPLLYHWRVLPGRAPIPTEHVDVDTLAADLAGSPAVRARLEALAAASHSLVLFSQYLPLSLQDWLHEDPPGKADAFERQLTRIVEFLRDRELLHMDGHFGNMRADGDRIYLTDFGLVTSPRFELSPAEHEFARRNATHDAGYAAMRLVNWLVTEICGVTVPADGVPRARNEHVRQCAAGHIPSDVPAPVAAMIARHAPAAARMNDFYWQLFDGDFSAEFPG